MKKLLVILSSLLIIVSIISLFFIINNIKTEIIVRSYDNSEDISLGYYSVRLDKDKYYIKDKKKFINEITNNEVLYKRIDDDNYILYKNGYYFSIHNNNNILSIDNYVYKSGNNYYESFTKDSLVPHVKMTNDMYFYNIIKYENIMENEFDIDSKEKLLSFYQSLNSKICVIDDNEIKILIYSDISLGYEFKIVLGDNEFIVYEKYYS